MSALRSLDMGAPLASRVASIHIAATTASAGRKRDWDVRLVDGAASVAAGVAIGCAVLLACNFLWRVL